MRVHNDSAALLGDRSLAARTGIDGKHIIDALPVALLHAAQAPLAALYVLVPVRAVSDCSAVRRVRLPSWRAAMELVRHAKVGALLGGIEAAVVFEHASRIAQTVPVYTLEVMRDLVLLPEAVETIATWHGGMPVLTT